MKIVRANFAVFCFLISTTLTAQITSVTFNAGEDAMVASGGSSATNYGSSSSFKIYRNNATSMLHRSFIKFDLSTIPNDAIVTEAKLHLTPKTVHNNVTFEYRLERADSSWTSDTLNWNNQSGSDSTDAITIPNSIASTTIEHQLDVMHQVQNMVHYPFNNHGWKISLENESVTGNDYGVEFYSFEEVNSSYHPKLVISYVLPVTIDVDVTHCTPGNSDGSVDISLSGGSGSFGYFSIMHVIRDTNTIAGQKYNGMPVPALNNPALINNNSVDVHGILDPGLYMITVRDDLYNTSTETTTYKSNHFNYYYHFLVGREGETVSGIMARYGVVDQVKIGKNMGTFVPNDYENENFFGAPNNGSLSVAHTGTNSHGSSTGVAYKFASLLNLNLDIAGDLEFTHAKLQMFGWTNFFQTHTSSNEVKFTPVTSKWKDHVVTWNSRPNVNNSLSIVKAKTSVANGYSPMSERTDTVDISTIINYWQNNPNHGIEISLTDYTYPKTSNRTYRGFNKNNSYFEFSFTVKPVASSFDEATGLGEIIVNAPSGALPYTYLLSYDTLRNRDSLWISVRDAALADSIILDSALFFGVKSNSRRHNFRNLTKDKYYITVIDSNGQEIISQEQWVSFENLEHVNTVNILQDTNEVYYMPSGAVGNAQTSLFISLANGEAGSVEFEIESLGEAVIGFNKLKDSALTQIGEVDFGIQIMANGLAKIIYQGEEQHQCSVAVGSNIRLAKELGDWVAYEGNTELYRRTLDSLSEEDYGVDIVLESGSLFKWKRERVRGEFKRNLNPFNVTQPVDCADGEGTISFNYESKRSPFNEIIIINLITGETDVYVNSPPTLQLPIGTYQVIYSYNTPTVTISSYQYVTISNYLAWDLSSSQNHLFTTPSGLSSFPVTTATGSTQSLYTYNATYDNWVSFRVAFSDYSEEEHPYYTSSYFRYATMRLNDQNGQDVGRIQLVSTLSLPIVLYYVYNDVGGIVGSGTVALNSLGNPSFLIETHGSSGIINVKYGTQLLGTYTLTNNNLSIRLEAETGAFSKIYDVRGSVCEPVYLYNYADVAKKLDGGYYLARNGSLKFIYNEEYKDLDQSLSYQIFNDQNQEVISNTILFEPVQFGDNRYELDFSCSSSNVLADGMYILKVTNEKNEVWYLRFKVFENC